MFLEMSLYIFVIETVLIYMKPYRMASAEPSHPASDFTDAAT